MFRLDLETAKDAVYGLRTVIVNRLISICRVEIVLVEAQGGCGDIGILSQYLHQFLLIPDTVTISFVTRISSLLDTDHTGLQFVGRGDSAIRNSHTYLRSGSEGCSGL